MPTEYQEICKRAQKGEIDPAEAGEKVTKLLRALRRTPTHVSFVRP